MNPKPRKTQLPSPECLEPHSTTATSPLQRNKVTKTIAHERKTTNDLRQFELFEGPWQGEFDTATANYSPRSPLLVGILVPQKARAFLAAGMFPPSLSAKRVARPSQLMPEFSKVSGFCLLPCGPRAKEPPVLQDNKRTSGKRQGGNLQRRTCSL